MVSNSYLLRSLGPDEFSGTLDCPICRQSYLVIGYHEKPFCFHCNTSVDAEQCEKCGTTHLASEGCAWCGDHGDETLEHIG
jgi:hypothetical protein